jgi:hypothetical protein
MIQAAAQQMLDEVQEAGFEGVDPVARLELHDTQRPAFMAAGEVSKMVAKTARKGGDVLALAAFVDRHVREAFEEGAVDPVHVPAT